MNDFYFLRTMHLFSLSFDCIYKKVDILTHLALSTSLLYADVSKLDPPGKVVCVVRAETLICSVGDAADSQDPQVTLPDPRHLHREVIL
jgi:hypothetical protein